ncbi:MAG: beta-ketoacyl-ACP synthase III [Candidatus Midichloria sp.]|uniref:Ketoacyl-ACP synthase III n=1 Tax=Hyalomma marginatum TaxID=34627 RepID=A0A8S4BVX0_9ACAR|nr:ketoacyl-ACP synthase III [Hyalomma marginatum]
MKVKIVGIGHSLPSNLVTNDELSTKLDTNDEWIETRTGIKQRMLAPAGVFTSDLATEALENAMFDANLGPTDLDGIILATTTPDLLMPATAVKVQQKIRMNRGFAFDIQAACTGFLYALNIGYSMIAAKQAKKIAIIGAETMSRILDWSDRRTCVLFGDGAGAVILTETNPKDLSQIMAIDIHSDGNTLDMLKVGGGISIGSLDAKLEMNGQEVYKFAIESMYSSLSNLLEKSNLSVREVDWVVAHQANYRIISSLATKLGIPMEKVAVTVDIHANTSAASIPLALSVYKERGEIRKGNLIALTAVGAGMTWGSVLLKL